MHPERRWFIDLVVAGQRFLKMLGIFSNIYQKEIETESYRAALVGADDGRLVRVGPDSDQVKKEEEEWE